MYNDEAQELIDAWVAREVEPVIRQFGRESWHDAFPIKRPLGVAVVSHPLNKPYVHVRYSGGERFKQALIRIFGEANVIDTDRPNRHQHAVRIMLRGL